jgi:hypothetical protein
MFCGLFHPYVALFGEIGKKGNMPIRTKCVRLDEASPTQTDSGKKNSQKRVYDLT